MHTDDNSINNFLLFYYIKQINSMLLRVCSLFHNYSISQKMSICVKTSATHLPEPCVSLFCVTTF